MNAQQINAKFKENFIKVAKVHFKYAHIGRYGRYWKIYEKYHDDSKSSNIINGFHELSQLTMN